MNGALPTNPQTVRFAQRRLTAALAAILGITPALAMEQRVPVVPQSWPLPHERSAHPTPLGAAMQSMRQARPAPAGHRGSTITVLNCADDASVGSLRNSVAQALSGDVIDLTQLTCSTITLGSGVIDVEVDDLTLRGPGAAQLAISADGLDRVFRHAASGSLTIEALTITRGSHKVERNDIGYGGCIAAASNLVLIDTVVHDCIAQGVGSYGGAILSGPLTMTRSTISGSTAFGDHPVNGTAAYGGGAFSYGVDLVESTISGNRAIGTHNPPLSHWEIGGGLFVARNGGRIDRSTIANNYAIRFAGGLTQEGDLLLRNSTVSGNVTRDDDGGGVRVRQVTSITIENSTIVDNQAGSFGGGLSFIANASPSTISSTIIAGNRSGSGGRDTDSVGVLSISGANNLVQENGDRLVLPADTLSADPLLLPLDWYGGPTVSHALREDSPAIDAGSNAGGNITDQRGSGFVRVFNGASDIGAFEYQIATGTGSPTPVAVPLSSSWVSVLMAVMLTMIGFWYRPRLRARRRWISRNRR